MKEMELFCKFIIVISVIQMNQLIQNVNFYNKIFHNQNKFPNRDSSKLLPTRQKGESCDRVMLRNGVNFSSFFEGVAHGIHSIFLEEIREFFDPDAPHENKIPKVNNNLSSEQVLLFNVPLAGYDEDFKTMSMKVLAFYMTNDRQAVSRA